VKLKIVTFHASCLITAVFVFVDTFDSKNIFQEIMNRSPAEDGTNCCS